MAIDASIIIVNWNTRQLLAKCLLSLCQNTDGFELEIIVVDNASTDDSVPYVRQNFPNVKLICNSTNKGFAAANNQGLALACGKNILFLNSDTIVHTGALTAMVELLDTKPDAALCACRLVNEDGSVQHSVRSFPTFRAMLARHTICKYLGMFRDERNLYRTRNFDYDQTVQVDQLMGAVLMTKRDILERIGPMDENLYFYFEETDLCRRARDEGLKVYFTPRGRITHLARASSNLLGSHTTWAMFLKSMFYYFRKHEGKTRTFLFAAVFKPGLYCYAVCEMLAGFGLAAAGVCLRREKDKIRQKLLRSRRCLLFLARYGLRFLFY